MTSNSRQSVHRWLVRHSIDALRLSLGLVFLGFGFLKYFPGVSPAQDLVLTTTRLLTFGLVPDPVALAGVATLECTIGVLLLCGIWMKVTVGLLAVQLAGILSPLVLLTGRLFSGPGHAPTLEGQYVLKDLILTTAVLVVAATVGGARLTVPEPARAPRVAARGPVGPRRAFTCVGSLDGAHTRHAAPAVAGS